MARALFNRWIEGDVCIAGTTVRSVNICEEMGRIAYLLSDKTGTLTRNDMEMRRIPMGTVSLDADTLDEFRSNLKLAATTSSTALNLGTMRGRRDSHFRIFDVTHPGTCLVPQCDCSAGERGAGFTKLLRPTKLPLSSGARQLDLPWCTETASEFACKQLKLVERTVVYLNLKFCIFCPLPRR